MGNPPFQTLFLMKCFEKKPSGLRRRNLQAQLLQSHILAQKMKIIQTSPPARKKTQKRLHIIGFLVLPGRCKSGRCF
jgi:hypothetical protein